MTRVALLADCHVGNFKRFQGSSENGLDRRCRFTLEALERACSEARDLNCEVLVFLGDLFNVASPPPQLIAAVMRIVDASAPKKRFALLGNHEMSSTAIGDHALAPLFPICTVIDRPSFEGYRSAGLLMVPYQPGPSTEWLREAIAEAGNEEAEGAATLACFHLGLETESTPPFLRGAADSVQASELASILSRLRVFSAALGNWHEKKFVTGDVDLLQVGSLCPTGFSNPGFEDYGWMGIWDSRDSAFGSIQVPGPRFAQVSSDEEMKAALGKVDGKDHLFVEWKAAPNEVAHAKKILERLTAQGKIEDGEVRVETREIGEKAKETARAVGSPARIEESVRKFVESMELPVGVDRGRILEEVTRYLNG